MEPKLTIGKSASLLKWLKAVLFQLRCAYKSPREIAKSDSVDLVWGLRVCVSNKLPGDVAANPVLSNPAAASLQWLLKLKLIKTK